jgi:hypothetical protein
MTIEPGSKKLRPGDVFQSFGLCGYISRFDFPSKLTTSALLILEINDDYIVIMRDNGTRFQWNARLENLFLDTIKEEYWSKVNDD